MRLMRLAADLYRSAILAASIWAVVSVVENLFAALRIAAGQ